MKVRVTYEETCESEVVIVIDDAEFAAETAARSANDDLVRAYLRAGDRDELITELDNARRRAGDARDFIGFELRNVRIEG